MRAKHYDGTVFHRVIPDFMIQGGNFTPEMEERPTGPAIVNEAKNGRRNARGTVAMARTSDPNSATDQFFINVNDNHRLDYGISGAGYAVFGEVIDGMDVVDRIALDADDEPRAVPERAGGLGDHQARTRGEGRAAARTATRPLHRSPLAPKPAPPKP